MKHLGRHAFPSRWALRLWLLCLGLAFSTSAFADNTWTGSRLGQPPAASLGNEGDYFIDSGSGTIYGPKTSNSWTYNPTSNYIAGQAALTVTNTFGGM